MSALLSAADAGHTAFEREVLAGLSAPHKCVPVSWLYDRRGCALAARAAREVAGHPAQAEGRLLAEASPEIATLAGPGAALVELGFGVEAPLARLLPALQAPTLLPPLRVADFDHWTLPAGARPLLYSPHSALARFAPHAVTTLLRRAGRLAGPGALLLVGVDATRDPQRLRALHDDAAGHAAAFHLNLVHRLRGELGLDLDAADFRHELRFDPRDGHVETHLVSARAQGARLRGRTLRLAAGESVHTASVRAYGPLRLRALAQGAGWRQRRLWTEGTPRVALHLFEYQG